MSVGIVTGASRGLGLALVRALVEREWRLVVDARGAAALERSVADLEGVVAIPGDVADPEHRRALVESAGDRIDLVLYRGRFRVNDIAVMGTDPATGRTPGGLWASDHFGVLAHVELVP